MIRRRRRAELLPKYHYHTRDQIAARLAEGGRASHEFVKDIGSTRQEFTAVPGGPAFLVDVDDALGRLDRWLD